MYLIGQKLTHPINSFRDANNHIIKSPGEILTVSSIQLHDNNIVIGFEEFPKGSLFPLICGFEEVINLTQEDILLWKP